MIYIMEIFTNSPCLWASFPPLTPLLVVSVKLENFINSPYEMLKLGTKCWISALNAQGSRGIIVAMQVWAVKIYVAAVEALWKKERQGETQEPSKLMVFWVSPCPWMLRCFLAGLKKVSPCVWPNSGYWCCLFLTLRISLKGRFLKRIDCICLILSLELVFLFMSDISWWNRYIQLFCWFGQRPISISLVLV